jgi:hypothetical protein
MTSTERCETTELLVDACGCPKHRGGQTVDEEAATLRTRLLAHSAWFAAQYAGRCEGCGTAFAVGDPIRMQVPHGWVAGCCS